MHEIEVEARGMIFQALADGPEDGPMGYDMANHAVRAGAHAQALDAEFIHRFGIAGPLDEAVARFQEIRDAGVDFVRVVPGSRDMPPSVGAQSIQALAKAVPAVA